LQAAASDIDGSVVRAQFYANGLLVGTATNSPYSSDIQVLTPGAVSFTAVAIDNLGLTATSAPVVITATGSVVSMTVTNALQLWLKADAGVTTNAGGVVTAWADQSGKGNNATQSDVTLAPKWVGNAAGAQPVLRFEGTNYLDFAASASLTITGDISSFFVVKVDDFANWRGVWGQTVEGIAAPNDYYLATGTGVPTFNRGDGTDSSAVAGQQAVLAGSYVVLGFDAVGTNINHYWNGLTNGTGTIAVTPADGGQPVRLGSRADLVTQMKGDIAEVLIFNRGLSETERGTIANYLASKYGIPFVRQAVAAGGPSLSVSRPSAAAIIISWTASQSGYVLESTPSLSTPTWAAVTGVQNNQVQVSLTTGNQFFRLRKP
jgi:hypothetical protein